MNRKFILVILALLLVFIFIEYRMPRHFVWRPSFSHSDAQPFGCQLFDSVLTVSMPQGYTVLRQTLWQLQHDSVFMTRPHGIVVAADRGLTSIDMRHAYQMAQEGHVLLVASNVFWLQDTIEYETRWVIHSSPTLLAGHLPQYDTVIWVGPPYDSLRVKVLQDVIEHAIHVDDSLRGQPLIQLNDSSSWCLAVSFPVGKGEIIVLSTPLLMTNYAMLDPQMSLLIARLMARLKHLPVVRTQSYAVSTAQEEQTPLYVLLQQPPLRWAVYLTILTIMLFMALTARRRQRVIPVVVPPQNRNLEFVRLVGTLYYQQGDHRGLVDSRLTSAAEEIRRLTDIDIMEEHIDNEQLQQLSRLTGMDAEVLRRRIANAHEATTGHHVVTAEEMKTHIDHLNDIINALK